MRCTASKQPTPTRGVESIIYKAVDRRTIQSTQRIHAQFMLAELSAGRTFALLSQRRGGRFHSLSKERSRRIRLRPAIPEACDANAQEYEMVQVKLRELKAELEKVGESFEADPIAHN